MTSKAKGNDQVQFQSPSRGYAGLNCKGWTSATRICAFQSPSRDYAGLNRPPRLILHRRMLFQSPSRDYAGLNEQMTAPIRVIEQVSIPQSGLRRFEPDFEPLWCRARPCFNPPVGITPV